jgi:hypothetical protein
MEDKGADASSVKEVSLKGVRDSDIYVGVFGKEYSEITLLEYEEAVKYRKPCLVYVKNVRQRDPRIEKFIKEILQRDFKYFRFGSNTKEITNRLEKDLQNFITETLRMGIQARAEKLDKTIELISIDEKSAANYITAEDPLNEVQNLFFKEKYNESFLMMVAIIEATLRNAMLNKGITVKSANQLGDLITLAQEFKLFDNEVINELRTFSIYRNQIIHLGSSPDKVIIKEFLDSSRVLINTLLTSKTENKSEIAKFWKPFPKINFNVGQWVPRFCNFPQMAWEAYNDSPYQLKVWIEVHPILGGRDLHPLKDNDINGRNFYDVEPESYVFANGCFTLPPECAISTEELVLEIRAKVEDVNDLSKGHYKLLPKRWKYIRKKNEWSYYPQHPVP